MKILYSIVLDDGEFLFKSQRDQIEHCLVTLGDIASAFVRMNNEKKKAQKKKKMVK